MSVRIGLVLNPRSQRDLRAGSSEAPEGNRIGKNAETTSLLGRGCGWITFGKMRIRSLESGTQDPSQGSRAQMPPGEAAGKSGDQGHYLPVVGFCHAGRLA